MEGMLPRSVPFLGSRVAEDLPTAMVAGAVVYAWLRREARPAAVLPQPSWTAVPPGSDEARGGSGSGVARLVNGMDENRH